MTLDVAHARVHAQRLVRPLATPTAVVDHLLAVQAQDYYGATWALARRAKTATATAIDRAFDAGEILRTHVLRPTWHFVTPADARWLLELTAPRVHVANAYWYKQAGLTAAKLARTDAAIADALAGGVHLTRDELARRLPRSLAAAMTGIVMHAELERVVISGPRRGKQFTYALFDERVPAAPALSRDDALARLARRFVASHGPTQAKDLAWWSGLTTTDAKRALELAGVATIDVDGVRYHVANARTATLPAPGVHLLPNYDECLVAFADRSAAHDPRVKSTEISVLAGHFVLSSGRLIGSWKRKQTARGATITCTMFAAPTAAERAGIEAEATRLGAFLETPAALVLAGSS